MLTSSISLTRRNQPSCHAQPWHPPSKDADPSLAWNERQLAASRSIPSPPLEATAMPPKRNDQHQTPHPRTQCRPPQQCWHSQVNNSMPDPPPKRPSYRMLRMPLMHASASPNQRRNLSEPTRMSSLVNLPYKQHPATGPQAQYQAHPPPPTTTNMAHHASPHLTGLSTTSQAPRRSTSTSHSMGTPTR
jgi:hypothetical protein